MIRRRLYSYNEPEERLYSTGNEDLDILMERAFCEGYEYAQREFAEKEEKKKRKIKLSDIDSHRGLGRSLILGGPHGAFGGFAGKKAAEVADEEGLSDVEIRKAAGKRGALVGAGLGALAAGTNVAIQNNMIKRMGGKLGTGYKVVVPLAAAASGALGGYLGADKNTKTRLKKRKEMERDLED